MPVEPFGRDCAACSLSQSAFRQPPLPTFSGFEVVAEYIAAEDLALSNPRFFGTGGRGGVRYDHGLQSLKRRKRARTFIGFRRLVVAQYTCTDQTRNIANRGRGRRRGAIARQNRRRLAEAPCRRRFRENWRTIHRRRAFPRRGFRPHPRPNDLSGLRRWLALRPIGAREIFVVLRDMAATARLLSAQTRKPLAPRIENASKERFFRATGQERKPTPGRRSACGKTELRGPFGRHKAKP